MVTCPSCGRPVLEGQRFCSNCGTDIQAASAYRAPQADPPPPQATPFSAPPGNAYGYEPGSYDYAPVAQRSPSTMVLVLIVAGVALLCLCCGLVLGAAGMYWLGPVPTSAPPPSSTPAGLLIFFHV